MIERMHSTLKSTLCCLSNRFPDWVSALPTALFAIRTAVSNRGVSPSLVVYGEQITIPGVFVMPQVTFNEDVEEQFVADLTAHWFQVRDFILKLILPCLPVRTNLKLHLNFRMNMCE